MADHVCDVIQNFVNASSRKNRKWEMSLNAKHISLPSSSLWYSPKNSAETRTDLIKGNFIDIASANFGVKLHGIFYLFLTKSGAFAKTGRQRVGHCQRNIIFQILKVIRNTLFTLDFLITPNITI